MPIVKFVKEKKEIEVPTGANLRKEALRAGVALYPGVHKVLNCHGLSNCGSCRVNITQGIENAGTAWSAPWNKLEKIRLGMSLAYIGNEATMRLACQVSVDGDMSVETQPPLNLYGENFFS